MAKEYNYDHYKTVPEPADKVNYKKKKIIGKKEIFEILHNYNTLHVQGDFETL